MEVFISVSALLLMAYAILMVRYYYGIQVLQSEVVSTHETPSITVVIALYNEEVNVRKLCANLNALNYTGSLDFLLVDDHSTDSTKLKIEENTTNRIRYLLNKGKGKKQAIETGVDYSNSDWIAVTDADCLMDEDWLNSMVRNIDSQVKMVLGPVFINKTAIDIFDLQKIEFYGLQGATAGSAGLKQPISANAANMLFNREVFIQLNPFQNNRELNTGDDQFLMMAIQKAYPGAVKYSFHTASKVITYPVDTWKSYWEQKVRWASKGSSYTDWNILITGLIVFVTSILFIESLIVGIMYENYLLLLFPLLKMLLDYMVISRMSKIVNEPINPFNFFISGMLYPIVVVYAVIAGFFKQ